MAKYGTHQGNRVKLDSPQRTPDARKKFKVYVRDPDSGNVKLVRFGDSDMDIKRGDEQAKRNFRSRHDCSSYDASDKTKPGYWSCKAWSDSADWVS